MIHIFFHADVYSTVGFSFKKRGSCLFQVFSRFFVAFVSTTSKYKELLL